MPSGVCPEGGTRPVGHAAFELGLDGVTSVSWLLHGCRGMASPQWTTESGRACDRGVATQDTTAGHQEKHIVILESTCATMVAAQSLEMHLLVFVPTKLPPNLACAVPRLPR